MYDLLPSINNPFTAQTVAGMQALWVIYFRVKENVYIEIYRMQSKWWFLSEFQEIPSFYRGINGNLSYIVWLDVLIATGKAQSFLLSHIIYRYYFYYHETITKLLISRSF